MYENFAKQILELDQKEKQEVAPIAVETTIEAQPAEETQVEAPVAETEVEPKVEVQSETEAPEETAAPEPEWYDLEDDVQQEAPKPVVQEPVQQTQEVEEVEEEDLDIQLLREFKKSGKSLRDFIKEVDVPDYKGMSDNEIIQKALREIENFTEDEYDNALEEITQMSLFQKKKLAQDYRSQFLVASEEKLKRLAYTSKPTEDQQKEVVSRFQTELGQTLKEVSGKEVYGLKITNEMSDRVQKYLTSEIKMNRKDGSIDVDLFVDFALWRLYGKDIVRTNVTKAKNDGRKELLVATTNPSSGSGPSNMSGAMKSNNLDDAFSGYLKNKN